MSDKRCGACKWFDAVVGSSRFGECRVIVLSTESRRPMSDRAWLAGADHAHLSVRNDFGCVLWEKKETGDE